MNTIDNTCCLIGWSAGNFLDDDFKSCFNKKEEKPLVHDYVADLPPELRSCISSSTRSVNQTNNGPDRPIIE